MKYRMFHSEMDYQSKWIEFETNNPSLAEYLCKYVENEYHIWDADTCGDEQIDFIIENLETKTITFLRIHHEWSYIDLNDGDGYNWYNEYYYEKLESVNFKYPKIDRDWMKIKLR